MSDDLKVAATGAAVGTGGVLAALSGLGVSGLGVTGVTSGLAAVGSVVGGGMAAGLAVTAAAPLAIGGLFYGAYKLLKK